MIDEYFLNSDKNKLISAPKRKYLSVDRYFIFLCQLINKSL